MEALDLADAVRSAWSALEEGDADRAASLIASFEVDADGGIDPDVALLTAHLALRRSEGKRAFDLALAGLSTLGKSDGELADAQAASLRRMLVRAADTEAGLAGKAAVEFAKPAEAKRASGLYSGLSTALYLCRPIPADRKADIVRHFALCAVACDNALMNMCQRNGSFAARLRLSGPEADGAPGKLPPIDILGASRESQWERACACESEVGDDE